MSKIYFISDLHLGAGTMENPLDYERRVVRFLDSIKDDCAELFLLGDIIDYWFEYKYVVPKGFTRFLGKLGELTDRGVKVHWFTGNHDIWIFDYISAETGATVYHEPQEMVLQGKRFYLSHGDGVGEDSAAYKLMAGFFRNKICQWMFKNLIHPDWATAFAHRWSRHSRLTGNDFPEYLGEDKEHLVVFAKKYLASHPETDYLLFGHRHIMLDLMLARPQSSVSNSNDYLHDKKTITQNPRMLILGDWITNFSYAVLEDGQLLLEQFEYLDNFSSSMSI